MSIELKVKQLSLIAEARIIQEQESILADRYKRSVARGMNGTKDVLERARRGRGRLEAQRNSLAVHRRGPVRLESRLTHLARGFIKGMDYKVMEGIVLPRNRLDDAEWERVAKMVRKYGAYGDVRGYMQKFEEWRQSADIHARDSYLKAT